MPDYYEELCITRGALPETISKAYRMASLKYHPDNNTSVTEATKQREIGHKFRFVAEAYEVLSNAKLRAVYDCYGEDGLSQLGYKFSGDAVKVFETFFGVDSPFQLLGGHTYFTKSGGAVRAPVVIAPVNVSLDITIEEAYLGTVKQVTYAVYHYDNNSALSENCKPQEKVLDVHIPRGIPSNTILTFPGAGHTQDGSATPGEVHCTIKITAVNDSWSCVPGTSHLTHRCRITLAQALAGFDMSLKTPDGRLLEIHIDEVVHPDYQRIIHGEGMSKYDATGAKITSRLEHGDLIITFAVEFPRYLTASQKTELVRILSS